MSVIQFDKAARFSGAEQDPVSSLERSAKIRLREYEFALEEKYGDVLLGIEDEFTVHGIDYRREDELIEALSDRLSEEFGPLFSSIDHEHPLMRVKDSVAAGQNQALHIPDTFRLELVTNHESIEGDGESTCVYKAKKLLDMRMAIQETVDEFSDGRGVVSWSPRPIPDLYNHLTKSIAAHNGEELDVSDILEMIKDQAREKTDLIGREKILKARNLEELLLGEDAPINNKGAAGSGVHLNIGFTGKDGVNPFYNPDDPDIGTDVTWNASAGVIDITAESVLPFTNLEVASWNRLGNRELSAPVDACYHPLKKGGAIVKQNPYSAEFYEKHNVPYKVAINEKNAHIEIRHADGGRGVEDGYAVIMMQLCASLAGIHNGLRDDKISSYDELMEYRKPFAQDFEEAFQSFRASEKLRSIYGPEMHDAVIAFVDNTRKYEEVWSVDFDDQVLVNE